jgi:hypothetical protein
MHYRLLRTSTVARTAEKNGFAWGYWQFSSDFLLYDFKAQQFVQPILKSLVSEAKRREMAGWSSPLGSIAGPFARHRICHQPQFLRRQLFRLFILESVDIVRMRGLLGCAFRRRPLRGLLLLLFLFIGHHARSRMY